MPTKTASRAQSHLAGTQKPISRVPSHQKSAWTPSKVSQDNTQTLWDPTLGSMEHHGSVKCELCEFHPFPAKIASQNCPNCCGAVLRGPQNWFMGVPARKKVLGGLLYCPMTPHNHYGTLRWGPQGTVDPAKSKLKKIHCFPAKFAFQNCQNRHGTILCDPKTHLQGSLLATNCLDASYSVPGCHTISMGPYLGVPRAPWVRQNQKYSEFHPFWGPRKKYKSKSPPKPPQFKKNKVPQK